YGNSISGNVQMPILWTSVPVSSSHNSMCDEATRISCGPVRVPAIYDVVRSSGTGRMMTRAFSNVVGVGVVPPNSPRATRSYSNGRFIHFLEAVVGNSLAVDRHHTRRQGEHRRFSPAEKRRGAGGER